MEYIKTLLALLLIIISVWYSNHITKKFLSEKILLLKIGIMFVFVLLSMWISDIIIFSDTQLLRNTTKDEILVLIKYLFLGIIGVYLYNENIKK